MSGEATVSGEAALRLRRDLSARMLPIAALLAIVVACAAPLAYLRLTFETLEAQAAGAARQIAGEIQREVEARPVLWRYGSVKLLDHVRAVAASQGLAAIAVVDQAGVPIDLGLEPAPPGRAIWAAAPLSLHGEAVATVWAAADPGPAEAGALRLLGGFGALALVLAGLVYLLPVRAIGRAEARIGGLVASLGRAREALAALNAGLEAQVAARSAELQAAYEALQAKEEHLRALSSRAVAMQEAERRVIARELHDSAGQALTAIRIHLQLIAQSAATPAAVTRLAEKTQTITDATLEEIRRAVALLGPAILDDVGLAAALERLCDDLREDGRLEVRAEIAAPRRGLTPAVESTIYRVCQEALTNVVRHAGARQATVTVRAAAGEVMVRVSDDGRGFAGEPRSGGHGLVGMRERVELLGGSLTIASAPGAGTTITATLPRVSVSADGDDSALVVA